VNHGCYVRKTKAETVRDDGHDIGGNIDPRVSLRYNIDKDFDDCSIEISTA
jgi:hypothetical protein